MENKQIIDGVDVSGCKNFSCGKCEEENKIPRTINHFTTDCRMFPNCYYKQLQREKQNSQEARDTAIKEFNRAEELKTLLKRKEQECEELKSQLTSLGYADAICALEIDLGHKTQECTELKKQLTDFMNGEYCANGCKKMQTQYKEYHTKLIEQIDQLKAEKEQAEQKLKQIEKLCIKNSTKSSFCNGIENKDMQKLAIRILQINEVK